MSSQVSPRAQLAAYLAGGARAAYAPVAARIIEVHSGGATDVNPKRFAFKHIREGLFGIDD